MDLQAIRELNALELAHIAGVSSPDSQNSPGAEFLRDTRDWYASKHAGILASEYPEDKLALAGESDAGGTGVTPHPTHAVWDVFNDLALYAWSDLDEGILGTITWDEITSMAEIVVGEVARITVLRLWQDDDANPDRTA